jgi:hypothetical protein
VRHYHDTAKVAYPACRTCEHCDGESSPLVRVDYLRGLVCPHCDVALDVMLDEVPSYHPSL